ncbi:MAG: L,D-transpeptidase [Chitinophagales bacterium]|nr:L,D-transpeptidase [Chitinophagales bacterium]
MKWASFLLMVALAFIIFSCFGRHQALDSKPPLTVIMDSLNYRPSQLVLLVDKSERHLYAIADSDTLKTYKIVLGGNPNDDKMKEGDGCTPEGNFLIQDLYPHQKWSKFMWINYPTAESWQRFNTRKKNGLIAQSDKIGGEIGIHGVPENGDWLIDTGKNWTLGCISLKNKDIDDLYAACSVGTKVIIRK